MEKPIGFIKQLIPKVMDGSKTQTRRVFSPQPKYIDMLPAEASPGEVAILNGELWKCYQYSKSMSDAIRWRIIELPYKVGDELWVQEGYHLQGMWDRTKTVDGVFLADGWIFNDRLLTSKEYEKLNARKWPLCATSGRFMYKSLARTWLKVLAVRYERLQDISNDDRKAEGVIIRNIGETYWRAFRSLWDSIYKKKGHGWDKNEYVRVIEFEVIKP